MKILVIGLGSMGRRRIRLILKKYPDFEVLGVDNSDFKINECKKEFDIKCFNSINEAIKAYKDIDAAFVCTSPLSHGSIIKECLLNNLHTFTEINLVNTNYDELIDLSKEKNKVLFLSSTFLYRNEVKYIDTIVKNESDLVNYSYHIGQYLPDWHPWESYNDYFIGNKATNGCREIFAIELPWISHVFGEIESVYFISQKTTNLNIDYNDTYKGIVKHKNGNTGTLLVDVVSRVACRNLEIFNENIYLKWNGTPEGLFNFENKSLTQIKFDEDTIRQEGYSSFIIENAYLNEIISFVDNIQNKKEAIHTFEKDKKILQIIDEIEKNG